VKLYLFCGHTPRSKDEQKKEEPRPLPTHDFAEKIVDEFSCKIQFAAAYNGVQRAHISGETD